MSDYKYASEYKFANYMKIVNKLANEQLYVETWELDYFKEHQLKFCYDITVIQKSHLSGVLNSDNFRKPKSHD